MLLSCVNRYSNSTSQAMDFTVCLMRYPKLPSKVIFWTTVRVIIRVFIILLLFQCANSAGLDYKVLNACLNGPEGEELLHQNGVETLSLVPEHLGVPWIVFNKVRFHCIFGSIKETLRLLKHSKSNHFLSTFVRFSSHSLSSVSVFDNLISSSPSLFMGAIYMRLTQLNWIPL